jgi:translation initiation factor 2B subunit (eIF-2B alpha/beta/delta family)
MKEKNINDGISGSVSVTLNAMNYLRGIIETSPAEDRSGFFLEISKKSDKLCKRYWYMAGINNQIKSVIREARVKTRSEKDLKTIRRKSLEQLEESIELYRKAVEKAAKNAAKLFYTENSIFVFSNSVTIFKALELYYKNRGADLVINTVEAKPGSEGIVFAKACADLGFQVNLYPDMNIVNAIANSDMVIIGADRMLCDEFFNKSGTSIVLEIGKKFGRQNVIVTDQSKILKLSDFLVGQLEGSPDSSLPEDGYRVISYYFERITYENIDRVVTEMGSFEFEDFKIRYLE